MTVIVDTPIWSTVYRHERNGKRETDIDFEMMSLIRRGLAVMIGPVRHEILSGLRDPKRHELLRTTLRAFDDLPLLTEDFEQAATNMTLCVRKGIQGSPTDFLLCAVAVRHDAAIFTTDRDFQLYAKQLKVRLHKPLRR
jgi:predicted nucleic acid-binding protein